jgi:isocitrate/isopropylmalate dehydrogenase
MSLRLLCLPGDGIGPEIVTAARAVLGAACAAEGVAVELEERAIGFAALEAEGTTIRFTLVAPFLFMVIAFAAFQSRQSLGDLAALMAVGMIGIFLRRFEFSRTITMSTRAPVGVGTAG